MAMPGLRRLLRKSRQDDTLREHISKNKIVAPDLGLDAAQYRRIEFVCGSRSLHSRDKRAYCRYDGFETLWAIPGLER
jgi:hypothetical protein